MQDTLHIIIHAMYIHNQSFPYKLRKSWPFWFTNDNHNKNYWFCTVGNWEWFKFDRTNSCSTNWRATKSAVWNLLILHCEVIQIDAKIFAPVTLMRRDLCSAGKVTYFWAVQYFCWPEFRLILPSCWIITGYFKEGEQGIAFTRWHRKGGCGKIKMLPHRSTLKFCKIEVWIFFICKKKIPWYTVVYLFICLQCMNDKLTNKLHFVNTFLIVKFHFVKL